MIAVIAGAGFLIAAVCAGVRLFIGPGLADRVIALDIGLISLMGAIGVHAAATGSTANLNLLVVIAIVGFTATVAATRFLEHAGREK